ncbi:rRNA pseudouridine synthase [Patescibacteria group bacterium]|nr:rRNA pseudouridine synthase [Patescibacteria group bacterium]
MKRPTPKNRARPVPTPAPSGSEFPMRLNKYLALKGYATRRDADILIEKKKVFVNGTLAQIGDKIREMDTVEVRGHGRPKAYIYLAFNKPAGMDTHREATGEKNVLDSLPADLKRMSPFPVGRLDKASHGLLLITNDGRITDRLLNPKHSHEKTYEVRTKLPLRATFKDKMEEGVSIEGYVTKPAKVEVLSENRFRITLTEGKTHQIRRMVVALFNEVTELKRIGIMNIKMGPVKSGGYRVIEGKELATFLRLLGLGADATTSTETQKD